MLLRVSRGLLFVDGRKDALIQTKKRHYVLSYHTEPKSSIEDEAFFCSQVRSSISSHHKMFFVDSTAFLTAAKFCNNTKLYRDILGATVYPSEKEELDSEAIEQKHMR